MFLAIVVGAGSTLLGLAFALIAARTAFRYKGVLRVMSVLPIITPPFVIGLAIILLFGRAGAISGLLFDWLDIPRSRWIYGLAGVAFAQLLAFTPIAFLVLLGVVQGISPSLEEASQTLRPVLTSARKHDDVHVLRRYVGRPTGAHLVEVLPQAEVSSVEALAGAHGVKEVRERVGEAMLQELLVLRRQLVGPRPGCHDELHLESL